MLLVELTLFADQADQDSDETMLQHWESRKHSRDSCFALVAGGPQDDYEEDLLHDNNNVRLSLLNPLIGYLVH